MEITKELLNELGLSEASKTLDRAEKLKYAYGHYTYITPERVDAFNRKLKAETIVHEKNYDRYKKLAFIPLKDYKQIPPKETLEKLSKAKKDFDYFEVCKIEWVKEVKDPILFGCIQGCNDRFFIAQWDDDIKLSDFLMQ